MRPNDGSQSRPAPTAGAAATVAISAQGDRSVLTPHTLTATMGGGATSVAWTSSTGTFDSASSLTPTYTPTTIGAQEVTCTPTGPLGAGAPDGEGWAVSRPLPVAANATISTVVSTLALQTEALSDTASADGVTWSTVVQRYTTSNTLEGTESVTGSTTTGPTWTPSALDKVYRVTSTATDAYGRTSATVRAVSAAVASATDLTLSLSTGVAVNQASPGGQVITATPTGGTGSKTYAWTATYINSGADAVALLSASTGNPVTLTTTAYSQRVQVVCTATDSGSPAQVAVAAVGVVVAILPITFLTPTAQAATVAGAASVTFTGASGGTPGYSYSGATLTVPTGSAAAATLTGSGVGPYDWTTDVPGSYTLSLTVTDSVGVTNQAAGVVAYAPPGPTWSVVGTAINWLSCTTASRSSAGTLTVYEQDGTTVKATITAAATGTPTGVVGCTNGTGLYSTYTSGTGTLWCVAPIGTPSSASKKVAVQSIVHLTTIDTCERAVGASNTLAPVANTQNYCVFNKSGANYQTFVVNRVANLNTYVLALSQASTFGTYVCVTVINDMKQQTVYVNSASSASDFAPMDALTGITNLVPRYDSSSLGTTPATYARTYSSVYQTLYAYGAAGTTTITASRLLEAVAES